MLPSRDRTRHPCFNAGVPYGRMHLPVALQCNIKCNYCNRKSDCVNESRPGVTSAVLTPDQALHYTERVLEREPRISVAGIAGPGDPMAKPEVTLETMRLIRRRFPELLLCLSSNGLGLPPHMDEIARIGVSHVTVTLNAVDPEIGEKIYAWVRDGKVVYRSRPGAEILLARQLEAIRGLRERGITVKVNTIVIPGVNDAHVTEVAKTIADLGANLHNCMPMYPVADTPFGHLHEPDAETLRALRQEAGRYVPQMTHCKRCRADAVGLLEEDQSDSFRECRSLCSKLEPAPARNRPYVAVATLEGMLINQHLGEARRFQIWEKTETGFRLVEERPAPQPGSGEQRWREMALTLKDCRAVLVSALGETPRRFLLKEGIIPFEMSGLIERALSAVYDDRAPEQLKGRRKSVGHGGGCKGDGGGCG